MTKKRILYLDGLKGIAAVCVMLHHFTVAYLPASFFGIGKGTYDERPFLDAVSQSPFSFLINGNFWVFLFLMISGYLLFEQGFKLKEKEQFSKKFLGRYGKLMIPLVPICCFVFLMKWWNHGALFINQEVGAKIGSWWLGSGYLDPISLKQLLLTPFTILFQGADQFSNAFWMLDDLFLSSLLLFVLGYVFSSVDQAKTSKFCFICVGLLFFSPLFFAASLGGLLAILKEQNWVSNRNRGGVISVFLLLFGCFCAGYPTGREPTNIYAWFSYAPFGGSLLRSEFYHILGAFLILFSLTKLPRVQKFLQRPLFQKLGQSSYAIYLIHVPLIYLLSPYLFQVLWSMTGKYLLSSLLTIGGVSVVILLISYFYQKWCSKLYQWFISIPWQVFQKKVACFLNLRYTRNKKKKVV